MLSVYRGAHKGQRFEWPRGRRGGQTYIQRIRARIPAVALHGHNGAGEELPRLRLELEHVGGRHVAQHPLQRGAVRAQQEELLPEALGLDLVFLVLVILRVASVRVSPSCACGRAPDWARGGRTSSLKSDS